ncbi:MAG: F0F1 ATP synthase subunit epsilon [Pseudomonadota bacterium]
MPAMHVYIVSAEGEIHSGLASMLFAPGIMGELGIAPRHAPLLTNLKPGEVRVQDSEGDEQTFFVSGGTMEVQPHLITILADTAIRADNIDEAAALEAKRRAEEALADRDSEIDLASAKGELAAAMAQLKTLEKIRRQAKR